MQPRKSSNPILGGEPAEASLAKPGAHLSFFNKGETPMLRGTGILPMEWEAKN